MRYGKLTKTCHELIKSFSELTNSFPIDVEFVKNGTQWTLTYNIIKIQFVLTKKEKLMCPASTLFCRIYLGKNDEIYFHIPELIEYLDENDFKCYYFSYIESEDRLRKCFAVLEKFLLTHFDKIRELSGDSEKYEILLEKKIKEMNRIEDAKLDKENGELLSIEADIFEKYVLIPRFAGDYGYREFMRGNYEKAIDTYQKSIQKNKHLEYEKRLLEFIKSLDEPYETIQKDCAAVLEIEEYSSVKADSKLMLKGILLGEILFGGLYCILFLIINSILGHNAVVYITSEWYWGFLIGALPALFGAIALRKIWAKCSKRKDYQKALEFDSLVNGPFVNIFSMVVFIISVLFSMFLFLQFVTCNSAFYEDRMTFGADESFISIKDETHLYEDLKEVVYSKGIYNEYDEFIARPSYLFIFENGTIWDSDVYTSIEVVEKDILPLISSYYDNIRIIEARE